MKNPFRYRWQICFYSPKHGIFDEVPAGKFWRLKTAAREARYLTRLHKGMYNRDSAEVEYAVKRIV